MEQYIPYLFLGNALLVIVDATLGYFMAPLLLRKMEAEKPELQAWSANSIRKLLSIVVALYMFFNCLAYFGQHRVLLLIVTGVVLLDIALQLIVRWKIGRRE